MLNSPLSNFLGKVLEILLYLKIWINLCQDVKLYKNLNCYVTDWGGSMGGPSLLRPKTPGDIKSGGDSIVSQNILLLFRVDFICMFDIITEFTDRTGFL